MFDLQRYLLQKQRLVNARLDELLTESPARIVEAMRYSLLAGGKRIRPVLCMAASEAIHGASENALSVACAIEMIHTYSLIHDDLPAMDNDRLRRGKLTCHVKFDEATAILAGDALLTLAFEVVTQPEQYDKRSVIQRFFVLREIAAAAGYKGMIEGQMRDIVAEGSPLSEKELESLHLLKTGALIEASVVSGAIMADATEEQVDHLRSYAKNIGLAFQVADDILNVEGDPRLMGKATGTDSVRNKNTYPSLMGLENAKVYAASLIQKALDNIACFDEKSEPLRAIATYIIHRKN